MKLSPLQLLHSQYTAISLFAREIPSPPADRPSACYPAASTESFTTKIELGMPEGEEDPHHFMVSLAVSSEKELPDDFPYQFAVLLEGEFHIDHDGDLEERTRLVVINGASMLFGVIREQLLSLTLRHKNGPLMLPSLDLRALGPKRKNDTPQTANTDEPKKAPQRKRKKPGADKGDEN
jgi:preprotein translocase subunit SecB